MHKKDGNILDSYNNATELFDYRVLKHNQDNLFVTDYSKQLSQVLHNDALHRINSWKKIIRTPLI